MVEKKSGLAACLALGLIALACSPAFAQAAPANTDAAPPAASPAPSADISPAGDAGALETSPATAAASAEASSPPADTGSVSSAASEESLPRITVQIEPPPISISSSTIGVAGPLGAKAAEGNPIFAEFVTEHHQDFADGNSITRTTSSSLYRDAQGRIRRESQLSLPGLPAAIASPTYITIVDRRLGCGWVLNPQEMVAHRYQLGQPSYVAHLNAQGGGHFLSRDAKTAARHNTEPGRMEPGRMESGSHHWGLHAFPPSVRLAEDANASPASPPAMSSASAEGAHAAERREESALAGSPSMRIDQPFLAAPNPVRTENLGEEMILGYRAHGKRVITTVPAGEIGNDRSIDIVSEQWYSPELDLVMRSMHRDPWGGEFTTKVVRVRRGEQSSHLFTVPSKYKVMDAESGGSHHVVETEGSRSGAQW